VCLFCYFCQECWGFINKNSAKRKKKKGYSNEFVGPLFDPQKRQNPHGGKKKHKILYSPESSRHQKKKKKKNTRRAAGAPSVLIPSYAHPYKTPIKRGKKDSEKRIR